MFRRFLLLSLCAFTALRSGADWRSDGKLLAIVVDTPVVLSPTPPDMTNVVVLGAASVAESSSSQYALRGLYDDGTITNLTSVASWSEDNTNTTISAGLLTVGSMIDTQTVNIVGGSGGFYATNAVTLLGVDAQTNLTITGAASIFEQSSEAYSAIAWHESGATNDVTASATWGEVAALSGVSINSTGLVTVADFDTTNSYSFTASFGGYSATNTITVSGTNEPVVAMYPAFEYSYPTGVSMAGFAAFDPPVTNEAADTGTPLVSEWTRSADPDEGIIVSAEYITNTSSFLFCGTGDASLGTVVGYSNRLASVQLPSGLSANEMYLMWPTNTTGFGNPVAINKTEAWWISNDETWTGQVFSVCGQNLSFGTNSWVYCVEEDDWLSCTNANPYKAGFTVPLSWTNGVKTLWAFNGSGNVYGFSDPLTIEVISPIEWDGTIYDITSYGADGTDGLDDSSAIQDAIDAAGAWGRIYCPSGTYYVATQLDLDGQLMFYGDGMDQTAIVGLDTYGVSKILNLAGGEVCLQDIEFNKGDTDATLVGVQGGGTKEHFYYNRVRFSNDSSTYGSYENAINASSGNRHFWNGCEFDVAYDDGNVLLGSSWSKFEFRNCDFFGFYDVNGMMACSVDQFYMENCTAQPKDASDTSDGSTWAKGRWVYGGDNPSFYYIGNCTTTNMAPRNPTSFTGDLTVTDVTAFSDGPDGYGTQIVSVVSLPALGTHDAYTLRAETSSGTLSDDCYNRGYEIYDYDAGANTIAIRVEDWLSQKISAGETDFNIAARESVDQNSGEQFLWEAMSVRQRSTITSITGGTNVTFAAGLAEDVTGCMLALTDGRGMGQAVRIVSCNTTNGTMVIERPFRVEPDETTIAKATEMASYMVFYNNTLNGRDYTDDADSNTASTAMSMYGAAYRTIFAYNNVSQMEAGAHYWSSTSSSAAINRKQIQPNFFSLNEHNTYDEVKEGITHIINDYNRNDTNYLNDVTFFGHVVRNNTFTNLTDYAFGNNTSDGRQRKDMTLYDGNEISITTNGVVESVTNLYDQIYINNTTNGENWMP